MQGFLTFSQDEASYKPDYNPAMAGSTGAGLNIPLVSNASWKWETYYDVDYTELADYMNISIYNKCLVGISFAGANKQWWYGILELGRNAAIRCTVDPTIAYSSSTANTNFKLLHLRWTLDHHIWMCWQNSTTSGTLKSGYTMQFF